MLLVSSCLKDIDEVVVDNWEPEFAVPLINTAISVEDLLDNFETGGYLDIDDDKFITLVYQGNVYSYDGSNMITIPEFEFPIIDTMVAIPQENLPVDYLLNKLGIKSGQLAFAFQSMHETDLEVTLQIPNLIHEGQMFEKNISVAYNGSLPVSQNGSFDIADYALDLGNGQLEMRYLVFDPSNGERLILDNVTYTFEDLDYNYVEGHLGQHELTLPMDSVLIDLFSYASGGSLYLEDPKIKLLFHNSFGLPVALQSNLLQAHMAGDQLQPIETTLANGLELSYPSISEVGQSKMTVLELNRDNSNIFEVVAGNPSQIDYQFSAIGNPNNEEAMHFVLDTSKFSVDVEVELPMHLRASEFYAEERIDFDAEVLADMIEAEFKLITENVFPLDIGVQVYFEDDNGLVLDSLLTDFERFMLAGTTDNNGKVISPGENTIIIPVSGTQLDHFSQATKLRIKGSLATANMGNTPVRFFTDYGLRCKLGVKAKVPQ